MSLPEPHAVVALKGDLKHVQGIEVDGSSLWVTSVDKEAKKGWLHEFDLATGEVRRKLDLTKGDQFHPGGLQGDKDSLWIPVAEYRRNGTSTIQQIDKKTLKVRTSLLVDDHIGAIAIVDDQLLGANWDAKQIIDLRTGKRRDNPNGTSYQDMKSANGFLIGSGLLNGSGAIDWVDVKTLELKKRYTVGKTDRGVVYTHEGMAIRDRKLYLLPEDGPSRLFIFDLPE